MVIDTSAVVSGVQFPLVLYLIKVVADIRVKLARMEGQLLNYKIRAWDGTERRGH